MKTLPWKWAQAGLLASLLIFALGQAEAAPTTPGAVRAVSVQGPVTVINDATQQATTVTEGEVITQGMAVQTGAGASVTLLFSNGSGIVVAQNSHLDISTFLQDPFSGSLADLTHEPTTSTTKLNLAYGNITASVKKLNVAGGSSFDVETPVGAAGVRGTTFTIGYDSATHQMTLSMGTGTIALTLPPRPGHPTETQTVSGGSAITLTATVSPSGQVEVTATSSTVPAATLQAISEAATSTANALITTPPPPAGTTATTSTTSTTNGKTTTTTTSTSTSGTTTTTTITVTPPTQVNSTNTSPSK